MDVSRSRNLGGILSLLFGVLLVFQPAAGALAVIWLIGFYAIVFGVINMLVAFRLRKLARRLPLPV